MITLFKGDDTGGLLGKSVVVEISTEFDLTGCTVIFNYQGIERRWENVHDGDRREVFFSHNETARMSLGVFKAVILAVDSSGKMRTITNSLPIKVSTNLSECYGDNVAQVTIGTTVNWEQISGKPFEGQEIDIGTDDKVLAALGTIIEKLGGTVKAGIALVALCAMSAFGYTPETHTNSFERDGVTYAQRGGLGAGDYVVTNVNASGDASILPRYLFTLDLDDTYPDDAEWYYEQEDYRDAGGCSVRRVGNTVERNLDWKFNRAAEFIVRVSGNDTRFASIAVANVGEHLTDGFVRSRTPSRYYKCLAGHSTDGINENGVFAEVNVTAGTWGRTTGSVHGLGAVRWVLDHGTNAQQAAEFIAANVYLPEGFGVNFHYLIADAESTYIVENGTAHRMDAQPVVMTNFNLDRQGGEGYERYDSLTNGATITSQWWTLAYAPETRPIRVSDIGTDYQTIWERWASKAREAHRGETVAGQTWWQTLHTAIYDLSAKTLRIAVQETDDWYVFALSTGGGNVDASKISDGLNEIYADRDVVIAEYSDSSWTNTYDSTSLNGRLYYKEDGVWTGETYRLTFDNPKWSLGDIDDTYAQYAEEEGEDANYLTFAGWTQYALDKGGYKKRHDKLALKSNLEGYVPTTRKINGQELTQDITIQGMTANALVLSNGFVKTEDGSETVMAAGKTTEGDNTYPWLQLNSGKYTTDKARAYMDAWTLRIGNDWEAVTFKPNQMFHLWAGNTYAINYPYKSGTMAVESWQSFSAMLTDATTNQTADCECICTNICKIISPRVVNRNEPHLAYINGEWHIITETEVE